MKRKRTTELNAGSISDIHLFHTNTPTRFIIDNLYKAFPDTNETGELDILFIVGDLFDRSVHYSDPNVTRVQIWETDLLRLCKKRDIRLRILEGTKSHDWGQSAHIPTINETIGADVKFVHQLEIEYIPDLDINILYVPDDLSPDTDETWKEVLKLLKSHGLDQVDYTLLHGSFNYQLPEHVNSPKHDPERYLSITKRYVLAGHIHKPSRYERILANGSFDRLTHNEEEPKGHWRLRVRDEGEDEIRFVENKGAKIYRTIDCTGLDVVQTLELVDRELVGIPEFSNIRIKGEDSLPIFANMDLLKTKYPTHQWKTKKIDVDVATDAQLLVDLSETYHEIEISQSNVEELLIPHLKRLAGDVDLSCYFERLQEFLNDKSD